MSLRVMVTVDVETPSATTGVVPEMAEFEATGAPAVNVTVPPIFATGVAIERVFTSAKVEAREQFDTPVASLMEQAP